MTTTPDIRTGARMTLVEFLDLPPTGETLRAHRRGCVYGCVSNP